MRMCFFTALYTLILVFGITTIGYFLGKLNKFGDRDEIIDCDDKENAK